MSDHKEAIEYYYKHKGGSDEQFTGGIIRAHDEAAARAQLDRSYGVERDNSGAQTNAADIDVQLITKAEFEKVKAARGEVFENDDLPRPTTHEIDATKE